MAVTINGNGQTIVQVVQTFFPSTFSTTSTSFTNVTGLSASITPSSASNKLLVIVNGYGSVSTNTGSCLFDLTRNGSSVGGGTANSNKPSVIGNGSIPFNSTTHSISIHYLDSPATTSAVTYQVRIKAQSGLTGTIGYAPGEADNADYGRYPSSITILEISGS